MDDFSSTPGPVARFGTRRGRTIYRDLRELHRFLPPVRKRELRLILLLSGVVALADIVTIGALLPFLALISGDAGQSGHYLVRIALKELSHLSGPDRFAVASATVVGSALVAAAVKTVLYWLSQRFVYRTSQDLAAQVLSNTLAQPYAYHLAKSSSELIATVNKVKSITMRTIAPIIQIVSHVITALAVFVTLVAIQPHIALIALGGICAAYLAIATFVTGSLRYNSSVIAGLQARRVQTLQEALGSVRDVLLGRTQDHFLDKFRELDRTILDARAHASIIGTVPRYIVETAIILVIVGLAYYLASAGPGLTATIPLLGGMILGIQKLLPAVQASYSGWAGIRGDHHSLRDVIDKLKLTVEVAPTPAAPQPFDREIRFVDVAFAYPGRRRPALDGINLTIAKGARIGIAGKSGGGKSTFADLVLGLLDPSAGRILVDGVALDADNLPAWRLRVGHVAQQPYLADCSIRENIAFCEAPADVDECRLARAIEGASLTRFVGELPDGLDTPVGEDGVRLSGGQKQRIGIARALYKQADVLVFDEATSALDSQTEAEVVEAIRAIDSHVTIVVIAHRPSTIAWCDRVLNFEDGRVVG